MTAIFAYVSLILTAAAVFAAVFARLKQPVVLAYLLVGLIASGGIFGGIDQGVLDFLSELGIAFTLFLIGLELRFSDIKQIGKTSLLVGLSQVIFTWVVGFFIANFLGFSFKDSLLLALAITFSSTIIVVNLLVEKRDLDSLYGKITSGYLIVQDFIAIGSLIGVTAFSKGYGLGDFLTTFLKGLLFVCLLLVLNRYLLQKIFDLFAKTEEVLFLASVSWALIFSTIFYYLGFSIEIGAFLAGMGLARLKEQFQIVSWIKPLRNMFVAIFFLSLGLHLTFSNLLANLEATIILSLFVIFGNPLIMFILMMLFGYRSRTSFHVAITSGQISEFSLILVALAAKLGLVGKDLIATTSSIALVTIVASTYLITYATKIYKAISPFLKKYQRKNLIEKPLVSETEYKDHVVLVGVGRLGSNILKSLSAKGEIVLAVEFDPDIVRRLQANNQAVIFGDISDQEIFDKAFGGGPKLIISTVFDRDDTFTLLNEVKSKPRKTPVIVTAAEPRSALEFYRKGADYVIVPRVLSSYIVARLLASPQLDDLVQGKLKTEQIEELSKGNF